MNNNKPFEKPFHYTLFSFKMQFESVIIVLNSVKLVGHSF